MTKKKSADVVKELAEEEVSERAAVLEADEPSVLARLQGCVEDIFTEQHSRSSAGLSNPSAYANAMRHIREAIACLETVSE